MFKQELSNYVDTVNLRTTVKSTPNVTIPRMIHITTKCPEQQPSPPDFLSSLLGTGDTFLLSLMGSLLGAPFSPITILCPGLGPIYDSIKISFHYFRAVWLTWECPRLAMLACSDLRSCSRCPGWWGWACGWPGAAWDSSATLRALLTVVAPEITLGGTE